MPETRNIKSPWLIQRCEVRDGRIEYDYMGSTEFEIGDQAKSLKRIFAEGMEFGKAQVAVTGQSVELKVEVYMVAIKGFPFAEYEPHLQKLAEGTQRLQEWTNFDDAVKKKAGIPSQLNYPPRTNAWFDFQNDVLWTLSEKTRKELVRRLEDTKKKWSKK